MNNIGSKAIKLAKTKRTRPNYMQLPKEVLEKAVEGGYRFSGFSKTGTLEQAETFKYQIVLDPKFFQALGKALGWKHKSGYCNVDNHISCPTRSLSCKCWCHYAHQYFDLVLTGGSTEKFWEKLLQ